MPPIMIAAHDAESAHDLGEPTVTKTSGAKKSEKCRLVLRFTEKPVDMKADYREGPLSVVVRQCGSASQSETMPEADVAHTTFTYLGATVDDLEAEVDVYQERTGQLLGRALVTDLDTSVYGYIRRPVVGVDLRTIGYVHMHALVISPFNHDMSHRFERISQRTAHSDLSSRTMFGMCGHGISVMGHRGIGATPSPNIAIKDNTLLSFNAAANLGCTWVEMDVHLTKDEIPVVHHDYLVTINPASRKEGQVRVPLSSLTLDELRKVEANTALVTDRASGLGVRSHSPAEMNPRPGKPRRKRCNSFSGVDVETGRRFSESSTEDEPSAVFEGVPTLQEVFDSVPAGCGFNIEIKYAPNHTQQDLRLRVAERNRFIDRVLGVVYEACLVDHDSSRPARPIMFSSFDADLCAILRHKQSEFPVMLITYFSGPDVDIDSSDLRATSWERAVQFCSEADIDGIVTEAKTVLYTAGFAQLCKGAGLLLFSYGEHNGDLGLIDAQKDLGCDGIIVDNVACLARRIRSSSEHKESLPPAVLVNC